MLIDVRAVPRSRYNPQFNRDALMEHLPERGLNYHPIAALGGLRHSKVRASSTAALSHNNYWQNSGFRNYADYAETPAFRAGLDELKQLGKAKISAIMCAEAVWWRCHRRIITDYLLSDGHKISHIMGPGKADPAVMTPSASRQSDGSLCYSVQFILL